MNLCREHKYFFSQTSMAREADNTAGHLVSNISTLNLETRSTFGLPPTTFGFQNMLFYFCFNNFGMNKLTDAEIL